MTEQPKTPQQWLERLKTLRDEAQVQAHLGSMELKGRLDLLEEQLEDFANRVDQVARAAESSSEEVSAAFSMFGDALARGFQRVKAEIERQR